MVRFFGGQRAGCLLLISALPVAGQNATPVSPRALTPLQTYTVEFKTVNVQTLANGTTITRETKEQRARDSQGRTFSLMTQPKSVNGRISDPVDNIEITWDSVTKKANVTHLPPQDQRRGCWTTDSHHLTMNYGDPSAPIGTPDGSNIATVELKASPKPERTRELLGKANIQGLEARGERWTTVIPAGQVGNDSPITTTEETWRASGLPFPLRSIYDDPRTGKRTRETVSLTIGEPDASLFQPPEGYEVVNEEMHEVACQR